MMVKKVQIMVRVYEFDLSCDYIIPVDMAIADVIRLIARVVFPSGHPALDRVDRFVLIDADRQMICPPGNTVSECGLVRGSSLLMV